MTEKSSHQRLKNEGDCETEIPIKGNRRLDKKCEDRATEIERSGSSNRIEDAISRLETQKDIKKELLVPNKDLDKAKEVAERYSSEELLIQNLGRTKRRFVNYQ